MKKWHLSASINSVIHLDSNSEQPVTFVNDGFQNFSEIVTLVETRPNSGIFDNADHSDNSNITVSNNAPRGHRLNFIQ